MATGTAVQTLNGLYQTARGLHDLRLGTVSQTLPTITQAVTGENAYFTLIETATIGSVMSVRLDQILSNNTILIGDSTSAVYSQTLTSTLQASDELTPQNNTLLSSVVLLQGAPSSADVTTNFAPKGLKASDSLTYFFSDVLTSTVQLSDTQQPIYNNVLQSTVYARNEVTTSHIAVSQLHDTFQVSGNPAFSIGESLTGILNAASSVTDYLVVASSLASTAQLTDSQITIASTWDELTGAADLADAMDYAGSVYAITLSSTVAAAGIPWARDFGAAAWVLNTESTGVSTYDNFEFTSIAEYNGVTYATSPEGVFALVGSDDAGRAIQSEIKLGFLDFGREQTKRVSDVFVGYTGGQLEFDVETYDGPQEVYTYQLEERDADAPRNNRLKVGRGLSSRYWRFTLRNVDGADFQVYDVTAEVGTSSRRL